MGRFDDRTRVSEFSSRIKLAELRPTSSLQTVRRLLLSVLQVIADIDPTVLQSGERRAVQHQL